MTAAHVRFLQNNQAAADGAVVTALSTASGFPVANAVDERRHKIHRTTGAFVVTASNLNVYINDGSDKTVALTAATYATGTALAAHVQTRLNASSTSWTCTYSTTTGKFTIGRSAGTAILRFTQTTNAAWSMLGYVGAVDTATSTGLAADERRNHTSECITFDLGVAKSIAAFIAITTAGETYPVSSSATLRLRASNVNTATTPWTSYDASFTVTRGDAGAFAFFTAVTYRYWQFEWIDQTNTAGPAFDHAVIYLGDYVEPASRNLNLGFQRVYVDPSVRTEADSGVLWHRRRTPYWRYVAMNVDYVCDTDRTELERVVTELGRSTPFFVSLDPAAAISATVAEFTKYVVFDDDAVIDHRIWKYYGLNFNLREVVG